MGQDGKRRRVVSIDDLVADSGRLARLRVAREERQERQQQQRKPVKPPSRPKKQKREPAAWRNETRECLWCGRPFQPKRSNQQYDTRGCYEFAQHKSNSAFMRIRDRHLFDKAAGYTRYSDPSFDDSDPFFRYDQSFMREETELVLDQLRHGIVWARHAGNEASVTELDEIFFRLDRGMAKVNAEKIEEMRAYETLRGRFRDRAHTMAVHHPQEGPVVDKAAEAVPALHVEVRQLLLDAQRELAYQLHLAGRIINKRTLRR